jgi:hypothetical protein
MMLSGWAEFVLVPVVFMASHFLPRAGGLRETQIGKIRRRPYFAVYGTIARRSRKLSLGFLASRRRGRVAIITLQADGRVPCASQAR